MAKRALVTGASRGMGKEIAVSLAEAGFDVAVAARTLAAGEPTRDHSQSVHTVDARPLPGSLEETADLVRAQGREALPVRMDLTDRTTVDEAMDVIDRTWGSLDLVVNNGRHIGPGLMDTIADTPIEQYPLFLMAHGVAPIRIAQLLAPAMRERGGGSFVTISSGAGYEFYPEAPKPGLGYRIGKAAGHTLVGSIQAEYGADNINAFNVNPGFVLTERNSLDVEEFGFDPAWAAPPAAVGAAVAWLVTAPEAAALQRQNLDAQTIALERNLYPDWRKPSQDDAENPYK
jgi:NAD(P)-dependent dehydrogenase (short-subunit alcohol dehydrogenase family)